MSLLNARALLNMPDSFFTLPRTAPLTPAPPPPPAPPPGEKCHGCQDNCCVVPRKWELPCQQQGVTSMGGSKLAQPPAGCEGGAILWSGDAWQQAPDDRKQHDPQWWVPLCFDKGGEIQNLTAVKQWRLQ